MSTAVPIQASLVPVLMHRELDKSLKLPPEKLTNAGALVMFPWLAGKTCAQQLKKNEFVAVE